MGKSIIMVPDGFVLEIEKLGQSHIICKRYTKEPIFPLNGEETAARIMDMIVDDLKIKTSKVKNKKKVNSSNKDNLKLILKIFKNESEILGESKIDLTDYPSKVIYQIQIKHIIPQIMRELSVNNLKSTI